MKLNREFFNRDTLTVAKDLLGKVLVRKIGKKTIRARILEAEAYIGEEDQACHARNGKTARNEVMYGKSGVAYVYLIYGLHHLLNIITEAKGCPAGVMIRRIEPLSGLDPALKSYGPGNVTRYLKIDLSLNKEDLTSGKKLWVEDDGFKAKKIFAKKRVGIAYAGIWAQKDWRFGFKD